MQNIREMLSAAGGVLLEGSARWGRDAGLGVIRDLLVRAPGRLSPTREDI